MRPAFRNGNPIPKIAKENLSKPSIQESRFERRPVRASHAPKNPTGRTTARFTSCAYGTRSANAKNATTVVAAMGFVREPGVPSVFGANQCFTSFNVKYTRHAT